jgi:hypothetical protein
MNIVDRIKKLKDEAQQLSQDAWTSTHGKDIAHSLMSILNDIGTVSVKRQPDFEP